MVSSSLTEFVQQYGLLAIFGGCIAEGESFAIMGGFLSHQGFFAPLNTYCVMFLGAFLGDTFLYLAGRFLSTSSWVDGIKQRPGFGRIFALVRTHPVKFIMLNRYAYGFRLIGGVASGLAKIAAPKFVALNALSSAIWAALFGGIGWFFGLGLEALIDRELHDHRKLIIGIAIGIVIAIVSAMGVRHYANKPR